MNNPHRLFAYGTLMWPKVMASVIGHSSLQGQPATLHGYVCQRVKGEHYPVILPSEGDSVEGIVYSELSAQDFQHLDRFEGEEYDRITVIIDGQSTCVYALSDAWSYIAEPQYWHPDQVSPEHLNAFCREYKGWQAIAPESAD